MSSLTNPTNGQTITVPDTVAESYTSRGWVRPGTPAPAEPATETIEEATDVIEADDDKSVADVQDGVLRGGETPRRRPRGKTPR